MNLTAEQIKQALECHAKCGECKESSCEYYMESNDVCMCDNISIAKDTLDYINHLEAENGRLQAQIEALQMDNNQLQSDIILANKDYEHIKELWSAEKESVKRANERFFNAHEKLKTYASHNANLERKLEAQRFSLAVHKEEIEKLQAECSILKQKRVNIFERIEISEKVRNDAIKEFLDKLIDISVCKDNCDGTESLYVSIPNARQVLKEMVGEGDERIY